MAAVETMKENIMSKDRICTERDLSSNLLIGVV